MIYVAFFKRDALRLETLKVGWSDNMTLVQKLYKSEGYKSQQKSAIEQVLGNMGTTDTTAQAPQEDTTATTDGTSVDKATLAAIEKNGYVEGKEWARITILEYSEMLCPYCKRQNDNKVMEQLIEKYGGDVNVIFQHYIVHPAAKVLAESAQCVGEQVWAKKFYSFIEQVFDLDDKSDAAVLKVAKSLWVKESTFTDCVKSGKYSTAIDTTSTEGRTLFGVTGTPGNVVIDNEKWTFTLIAGAYPVDEFVKVIDGMLAK